MNIFRQIINMVGSGTSFEQYYRNMNRALKRVNDEYTMLHFPFYRNDQDSFLQAQKNLTDYCVNRLDSLEGKSVLEVGCGNGVQAKYIHEKFKPEFMTGIDLDEGNISIANSEKDRKQLENIYFHVSNAQNISVIGDNSIDVVINIESAFHYPDKLSFLNEIFRVLKPGGHFLIADLLTTTSKGRGVRRLWKNRMVLYHWHKHQYENALQQARLEVIHDEDITEQVIKGFGPYRSWIRKIKKTSFINDMVFRIFYTINIMWTIFLLRFRRQYYLFVGLKPVYREVSQKDN